MNIPPCDALRPWVAGYSIQESDGSGAAHDILPGLQPELGFQYRGRMSTLLPHGETLLETAGITGLQSGKRRYLGHLDDEEVRLLPLLQGAFTDAELAEFSRQSVAATAPPDQAMMLGHMFPAMQASELREFFVNLRAKASKEAVQHLEGVARNVLGPRAAAIGI